MSTPSILGDERADLGLFLSPGAGAGPTNAWSDDGRKAGTETLQPAHEEAMRAPSPAAIDLYWLPLGAGGHVVRLNGRAYEALVSFLERRPPLDLYHSALVVRLPEGRFTIESAPVPDHKAHERGAVAGGPVGSRWAGRFRIFRYEIRCWREGVIPDLDEAVDSPQRLTEDEEEVRRLLDMVPKAPTPVWGRDELKAGEMWNSNSIVSWLLVCSGLDEKSVRMPSGGRAPGWDAGLVVARRQNEPSPSLPSA